MTTESRKTQRYTLLAIIVACALLITVFSVIQNLKTGSREQAAYSQFSGYVLTEEGISEVEQNADGLHTTPILEEPNIRRFEMMTADFITYTKTYNTDDETKINAYTYDTSTKTKEPLFESTGTYYYSELKKVDKEHVAAIRHDNATNTRTLQLTNPATGETKTIQTPAPDNVIVEWEPSPDGKTLTFKGMTNDIYMFNLETNTPTLLGTHDGTFGYLNENTIWASNLDGEQKMTVYSTQSTQSKPVTLDTDLSDKTFLNGTLIAESTPQKVLWSAAGFFTETSSSQKLITTTGDEHTVLYDFTDNGYTLSDKALTLDLKKQLVAAAVTDSYDSNIILVLKISNGELLTTLFGSQFIPSS